MRIRSIVSGGPALRAGIAPGDTIIKVQGQDVHSARDVREIAFKYKPGDAIDILVKRGNRDVACKLILGDYSKINVPH